MGDKKKKIIILASTLGGVSIIAGTVIGAVVATQLQRKEQQIKTVATVKIISDIPSFSLEEGTTLTSDPIEVKCYTSDEQEIKSDTKLCLYDDKHQIVDQGWIYLNESNQIVITESATKGDYTFYLQASTECGNEIKFSEEKEVKVNVYKQEPILPVIDKLTINGLAEFVTYPKSTKKLTISAQAWAEGIAVPFQDGMELEWGCYCTNLAGTFITDIDVTFTTRGLYCETIDVSLNSNANVEYGQYILNAWVRIKTKTETYRDSTTFRVVNGYERTLGNIVYTRSTYETPWTITKLDVRSAIVNGDYEYIDGYPVDSVADNFAERSLITDLVSSVTLPKTVIKIGDKAFENCTKLQNIQMPGVTTVGYAAFNSCGLMTLAGEEPHLEDVGEDAFYSCESFKVSDLTSLKTVWSSAFYNTAIEEIYFSDKISNFSTNSFCNCKNLKTVYVNSKIPPLMDGLAFYGCSNLTSIYVPAESISAYSESFGWMAYKTILKPYN